MHLLLTRSERVRYLGFDDHWAMLLGVPLLSLLAFLFFAGAGSGEVTTGKIILCSTLGLLHTVIYWFLNRSVAVNLRYRLPRREQTVRRILLMLLGAVVIVLGVELTSRWLFTNHFPYVIEAGYGDSPLPFQLAVSFTLCLLVLAVYESVYFFAKYKQSILEQERLSRANVQAQLSVLKEQVNPHFLFNSLNTLTSLIPEDQRKATVFTQRLAATYRRILEYRQEELIPLHEELSALEDYIFLMQTRFEDKLQIRWNGGAASSGVGALDVSQVQGQMVPLTLQLLVENALKHNVVSQSSPLRITISITAASVSVTNSLHLRTRPSSTGWGQDSIRRRYRILTNRPVVIERTEDEYRVTVPLLPAAQPVAYVSA